MPPPKKSTRKKAGPERQKRSAAKHPVPAARKGKRMTEKQEVKQPSSPPNVKPGVVTQTMSTEAGPYAHINDEAQQRVQDALNLRVEHDRKVPLKPPEVPPGLSPNQIVQLLSHSGTVSGSEANEGNQSDKPQDKASETKGKSKGKDEEEE